MLMLLELNATSLPRLIITKKPEGTSVPWRNSSRPARRPLSRRVFRLGKVFPPIGGKSLRDRKSLRLNSISRLRQAVCLDDRNASFFVASKELGSSAFLHGRGQIGARFR
jgi:hypothetical protein